MLNKTIWDALTVTVRLVQETVHGGRVLAFWLLFPALMLLLFGSMYAGGTQSGSGRSFETTVPGILIGAALFFSCLSGPVVVLVGERERGTLRRLLFMPLSGTSYFLGVLLHFALVAMLQTVVVYGLAYLFGGRFHGPIGLGVLLIALAQVGVLLQVPVRVEERVATQRPRQPALAEAHQRAPGRPGETGDRPVAIGQLVPADGRPPQQRGLAAHHDADQLALALLGLVEPPAKVGHRVGGTRWIALGIGHADRLREDAARSPRRPQARARPPARPHGWFTAGVGCITGEGL